MANYDLTYEGSRVQSILDTGDELRDAGYIFRGEATPSTVPGTPTERVAYIGGPGTYTNFGSTLVVPMGGIGVFKYNGTGWNNYAIIPGIGDGGVFDLSAYNAQGSTLATYADLSAALTALNSVPANYKRGGMTMKFVLTVSGIYVQYRLQSADFNINPANWVNVEIRINEAVASEAASRQNADAALQNNINNEAAARQNADAALQNNINNEAAARQNADAALQNDIDEFEDTIRTQIDEYRPIEITGDVTNAPDEEDLTSVDQGGTNVLKFKDRNNLNGMGMIIMRRDKTFSEQLTQTNTIYVIRYDFELDADVTIPANCVLEFDGGSISGEHTITGNNTYLEGIVNISCQFVGSVSNTTIYSRWFDNNTKLSTLFNLAEDKIVILEPDNYNVDYYIRIPSCSIYGNNATITITGLPVPTPEQLVGNGLITNKNWDVVNNIDEIFIYDLNLTTTMRTQFWTLLELSCIKKCIIQNCSFIVPYFSDGQYDSGYFHCLDFRWQCDDVIIKDCRLENQTPALEGSVLWFRNVSGIRDYSLRKALIDNCVFESCAGDEDIALMGPNKGDVVITNNKFIHHQKNGIATSFSISDLAPSANVGTLFIENNTFIYNENFPPHLLNSASKCIFTNNIVKSDSDVYISYTAQLLQLANIDSIVSNNIFDLKYNGEAPSSQQYSPTFLAKGKTIINNIISINLNFDYSLFDEDKITIVGNKINAETQTVVLTSNCHPVKFNDNEVIGIILFNSQFYSGFSFAKNNILDNTAESKLLGYIIPPSEGYCEITDNIFKNLNVYGIANKSHSYINNNNFVDCSNVNIKTKGTTSNRPVLTDNNKYIGFTYIDETLNKPIWWIGAAWVDATGATV